MGSSGDRRAVGDKSPLSWHRTRHLGYVKAVARELNELGVRTARPVNESTNIPPKRIASLWMHDWAAFPWCGPCDISVYVAWDEEVGWTVNKIDEINAGPYRGRGETRYGLGLDLVHEPAEAALRIGIVRETESESLSLSFAQPLRQVALHDPQLEAALAAYLPPSSL